MKKLTASLMSAAMLLSLASCGSSSAPSSTPAASAAAPESTPAAQEEGFKSDILFCGSTSLYPIMSSLASSFTEEYVTWDKVDPSFPEENISIYVAPGGSGVGVSAAVDHTADFGMLARDIKDSEKEALGANYSEYVVARDALTVSVNAQNPICDIMDDMDTDTIRGIFDGTIATWDQVDSSLPAEAINVYIRDLSGGAYEVFQKAIMGDSEVTASATQSASMTELATNIANDPWGIGYAGFGAYNKANADSQVLFAMKVDGVEPTAENIISGDYTVQRPVMFVTGDAITEPEQKFIDYVFSQTGYDVVEANGYIPAFTPAA
ncbi:phosphate ABC transporter substrate-binding protein [Pseudoflavonifractor sp. MSJ-37]|uniref:phosphate ABC transporter substrate-binding protein n=1 Tax=Pseudoflavonifractor sp. MSJ-37 TaxID=2841531 RepID=UPI001C104295|nr:phosphate ABC transporter substrate-binding protein [Pseudoflavonifractor sp. MSJ-37]MBU5434098.1 phosphate ABC transporter substrate-binding protein [Pseudoflavonifractor sp. MSJ-37]